MARKIDWEAQLGRRLNLRDLHVFSTVVQRGSMAKAAEQLGVTQPAVSELISDLEHALGARLLDRGPRGVEPTAAGRVLLRRSNAAFDELRQGIREIQFLADPAAGELRIGAVESIATVILPPIIQGFFRQYPRVVLQLHRLGDPPLKLTELRERGLDLVLARVVRENEDNDLDVDVLLEDEMVVTAGAKSPWASRNKIDLAELVDEPWILTPPSSWTSLMVMESFRMQGLPMPRISLTTFCTSLRASLVAGGPFITAFPRSIVPFDAGARGIKILPIDLPLRPWPVAIITLKNRSLSPVAQLFIDHVRASMRSTADGLKAEAQSGRASTG